MISKPPESLRTSCLLAGLFFTVSCLGSAAETQTNETINFERDVRPIFESQCASCHGSDKREAGLRLDVRSAAMIGGDSGRAIVAGRPQESSLVERVTSTDSELRMPLGKAPLTERQINLLRNWIAAGAHWPDRPTDNTSLGSNHRSFRPIDRPELPRPASAVSAKSGVDLFIQKRLEKAEIRPSPAASGETLIRRLFLDLTGLPPSPDDIHGFLADDRPGAWERLVDRLLASPHFGERWGQHWLDLARYADSDGYEMDYFRPHAWRWRDWVIQAINADMPFSHFSVEQLAGDLLSDPSTNQIVATGFHRNSPTNTENGIDAEEFRGKAIVDRVNTTGTVWLGLTIGCAECHSHKYDPISQRDFYGLFAFFNDLVDEASVPVPATAYDQAQLAEASRTYDKEIMQLEQALGRASDKEQESITKKLRRLRTAKDKVKPVATVFGARSQSRTTHVHLRGNFLDLGPAVTASIPAVLTDAPQVSSTASLSRLDLARWILSPDNPLTARVAVNRIWQHLFGQGLVRTPDDFGSQGQRPSHPDLLDWLACEFQEQEWSRKQLVRLIVTSTAYQQSSRMRMGTADVDNRLVWRQNRVRLDAETLRDQYLAASGMLRRQIGGPSFHPPLPPGLAKIGFRVAWAADPAAQQRRRGLYIVTRRNLALPMLTTFDRPDANLTCTIRERSNTPLQSLTQMNDALFVEAARALAIQVLDEQPSGFAARLDSVLLRCLARYPTAEETTTFRRLLDRVQEVYHRYPASAAALLDGRRIDNPQTAAAWTIVARTVMNLDEFITRE